MTKANMPVIMCPQALPIGSALRGQWAANSAFLGVISLGKHRVFVDDTQVSA